MGILVNFDGIQYGPLKGSYELEEIAKLMGINGAIYLKSKEGTVEVREADAVVSDGIYTAIKCEKFLKSYNKSRKPSERSKSITLVRSRSLSVQNTKAKVEKNEPPTLPFITEKPSIPHEQIHLSAKFILSTPSSMVNIKEHFAQIVGIPKYKFRNHHITDRIEELQLYLDSIKPDNVPENVYDTVDRMIANVLKAYTKSCEKKMRCWDKHATKRMILWDSIQKLQHVEEAGKTSTLNHLLHPSKLWRTKRDSYKPKYFVWKEYV